MVDYIKKFQRELIRNCHFPLSREEKNSLYLLGVPENIKASIHSFDYYSDFEYLHSTVIYRDIYLRADDSLSLIRMNNMMLRWRATSMRDSSISTTRRRYATELSVGALGRNR